MTDEQRSNNLDSMAESQTTSAKAWRELGEGARAASAKPEAASMFTTPRLRASGRALAKAMREHASELQRRAHETDLDLPEPERIPRPLS